MAKGMALTIGLNAVDPVHYRGWSGVLNASESDASAYANLAKSKNYEVTTLLTKDATREKVISEISRAANTLKAGDIFILGYSGHGGQIPDLNGDEEDGLDETICLYDGQLIDDELNAQFAKFIEGVRVLVFSDSCHSGTVTKEDPIDSIQNSTDRYKYMPLDVCKNVYEANKSFYNKILQDKSLSGAVDNIKATVLLLSGCQDNQFSRDGVVNSLFTAKLLSVWNNGLCDKNYRQFYDEVFKMMPSFQQPNYYRTGKIDPEFEKEKVLEI